MQLRLPEAHKHHAYSHIKRFTATFPGKVSIRFRSGWEFKYACYLEFIKNKKQIKEWQHEPKTFWFEKIKRGVRSYLPDFEIKTNYDTIEYHEVKGYMDAKSATKIKRMNIYYPHITLKVIEKDEYKAIMKWWSLYEKTPISYEEC